MPTQTSAPKSPPPQTDDDLRIYVSEFERKEIAGELGLSAKSVGYILRKDWQNKEVTRKAIEKIRAKAAKMNQVADKAEKELQRL